ncbi:MULTISPECIES: rod shape-determining protein [Blattabacterium]|uniref:rod shape-determining protein n=1 Tax=Blattabacterium TaxID=34098 RepID=UPI00023871D9|nr:MULTISPECIES: rod shape-determining protein [Blattabacterium]AEU09073.1 rod shape-determining protein MreB [Blattabacterium sp. (Cryptocercus punctulatus) str. Cpu]AWU44052.1 rod shape-determining protein [Blattabacterium punctulatus]AWU45138.1 rod shape-determining protein [Blattabacterium punctulatus]
MGLVDFINNLFNQEIAIDLGTANTLIMHNNKVIVDLPSIIAIDVRTKKVLAVGEEAKKMQGKTHDNIKIYKPLKDGVIADYQVAELMIREFIKKVPGINKKFFTPSLTMVICIPSGITEVEKRAVKDSAQHLNAKEVYLIEEPMAAAIGSGISVTKAEGNMIIDIGGGTTECGVIALGGIVCQKSIKIAGDVFTNDIAYFLRTKYNLYIGERTAEKIKIDIGAAAESIDNPPENIRIQGRDLPTGKPKEMNLSYKETIPALDKSILRIEDAVMETLSSTPPELAADIYNTGIYMAGGGSLLRGLDKRISKKTGLSVSLVEDPLRAVVKGTGVALKNIDKFTFLMK